MLINGVRHMSFSISVNDKPVFFVDYGDQGAALAEQDYIEWVAMDVATGDITWEDAFKALYIRTPHVVGLVEVVPTIVAKRDRSGSMVHMYSKQTGTSLASWEL